MSAANIALLVTFAFILTVSVVYRIKLLLSFNRRNIKKICESLDLKFYDYIISFHGKGTTSRGKIHIRWLVFAVFRQTHIFIEHEYFNKIRCFDFETENMQKATHLASRHHRMRVNFGVRNVSVYDNIWIGVGTDLIPSRMKNLLQSKQFQDTVEYFVPPSRYYLELKIRSGIFILHLLGTRRNNEEQDLQRCMFLYDKMLEALS